MPFDKAAAVARSESSVRVQDVQVDHTLSTVDVYGTYHNILGLVKTLSGISGLHTLRIFVSDMADADMPRLMEEVAQLQQITELSVTWENSSSRSTDRANQKKYEKMLQYVGTMHQLTSFGTANLVSHTRLHTSLAPHTWHPHACMHALTPAHLFGTTYPVAHPAMPMTPSHACTPAHLCADIAEEHGGSASAGQPGQL